MRRIIISPGSCERTRGYASVTRSNRAIQNKPRHRTSEKKQACCGSRYIQEPSLCCSAAACRRMKKQRKEEKKEVENNARVKEPVRPFFFFFFSSSLPLPALLTGPRCIRRNTISLQIVSWAVFYLPHFARRKAFAKVVFIAIFYIFFFFIALEK